MNDVASTRTIPDHFVSLSKSCAQRFSVSHRIHDQDFIFWAIHDDANLSDKADAVRRYFESGSETAAWIKNILESLSLPNEMFVLDFASGYGRVARHLVRLMPKATIVASDIHADAVSFNKSIGVQSVLSTTDPDVFDPGRKFDAIVAISFFTHMPEATWGRWLTALSKYLTPSGKLIFSTHGRVALKPMGVAETSMDESGFAFFQHSEQKDLQISDYGSTVSYFEYVYRKATEAGMRVCRFVEGGVGYQDLVILTPATVRADPKSSVENVSDPAPASPNVLQVYKGYEETDLRLFDKFAGFRREPCKGFIVDFLGVRTRVAHLWNALLPLDGHVLGLPIPGDWHAEAVEWLGLLKTAITARETYFAMEWGAGWAPWLVAGAAAARVLGVSRSRLYGVEADPVHFGCMCQHFIDNDLVPDRHVLLQAAVGRVAGKAVWPTFEDPDNRWGDRPLRNGIEADNDYFQTISGSAAPSGFIELDVIAAADLLKREPRWDMIHIDIQGWEGEVCRSCIELLSERARWVIIGVHSRVLDGALLELFHAAGWTLEHEKPTQFRFNPERTSFEAMVTVDGVQVWRNPRLVDSAAL